MDKTDFFSLGTPLSVSADCYTSDGYQFHEYDLLAVYYKDGEIVDTYRVAEDLVDISLTSKQRSEIFFESRLWFYTQTWSTAHLPPESTSINYIYTAVPGAHYKPNLYTDYPEYDKQRNIPWWYGDTCLNDPEHEIEYYGDGNNPHKPDAFTTRP